MHAAALARTELNTVVLTRLSPYHNTLFMRVGKSFCCLKKIQEFFQLCLTSGGRSRRPGAGPSSI